MNTLIVSNTMTHQHVTRNKRLKRVDTRPNSKARSKQAKQIEAKKTVQDLKVTRVQQKKERSVASLEDSTKSKAEIYIRSLKKKLRAIDELIQRKNNGEELDENQLTKVSKLDSILSEMDKLIPTALSEEQQ